MLHALMSSAAGSCATRTDTQPTWMSKYEAPGKLGPVTRNTPTISGGVPVRGGPWIVSSPASTGTVTIETTGVVAPAPAGNTTDTSESSSTPTSARPTSSATV